MTMSTTYQLRQTRFGGLSHSIFFQIRNFGMLGIQTQIRVPMRSPRSLSGLGGLQEERGFMPEREKNYGRGEFEPTILVT